MLVSEGADWGLGGGAGLLGCVGNGLCGLSHGDVGEAKMGRLMGKHSHSQSEIREESPIGLSQCPSSPDPGTCVGQPEDTACETVQV